MAPERLRNAALEYSIKIIIILTDFFKNYCLLKQISRLPPHFVLKISHYTFFSEEAKRIFPRASVSRPALGLTQPPVQWVPGVLFPE
jgi:hypothetical protein